MHLNIYNSCKKATTFSVQKKSSGEIRVKVYKQSVDFGDFFMEANNMNPDQTA